MESRHRRRWLVGAAALLGCIAFLWMLRASQATSSTPLHAPVPTSTRAVSAVSASSAAIATEGVGRRGTAMAVAEALEDPRRAACQGDYNAALRELSQALAGRPDVRSQLARGLLNPVLHAASGEVQGDSAEAFARARSLAPDDRLVAWTEATHCQPAAGCDRDAAVERLLRVDPGNTAAWLLAMEDARRRGDSAGGEMLLARAAQAERYDVHFSDTVLVLAAVLQEMPALPRCSATAEALGRDMALGRPASSAEQGIVHAVAIAAAFSMPGFSGLSQACAVKAQAAPTGTRRLDCMAVLARMAESETMLARLIGLSWLAPYTADRPDGAQYRERLRNLYWLQEQAVKTPTAPDVLLDGFAAHGEVEALQARLAASGRWPAPAGWLPRHRCQRALVTTGRRPRGC